MIMIIIAIHYFHFILLLFSITQNIHKIYIFIYPIDIYDTLGSLIFAQNFCQ